MLKLKTLTFLSLSMLCCAVALFQTAAKAHVRFAVEESANKRTRIIPAAYDDSLASQATAAINSHYNSTVEAVTEFKPFYLTGDFNADGAQDLLSVVKLKVAQGQLPKDVRIVKPFGFEGTESPNQSASAGGETIALGLAILHGGKGGWRVGKLAAKYLLLGGSPLQILTNDNISANQVKDLMTLVPASRTRRRKYGEFRVPRTARGAWILVGTQVGEGLVYWDGKTYRFQDSPDD
ncbi:MAG TPA: hypothetical protein VF658_01835 [Pyrinomonadaceae bacterium]|jgi:hypothetical protein